MVWLAFGVPLLPTNKLNIKLYIVLFFLCHVTLPKIFSKIFVYFNTSKMQNVVELWTFNNIAFFSFVFFEMQ